MKYIIIVPDGAADHPMAILGGKTPLEAAETPFMDSLSRDGVIGRVKTVPKGFSPSSDVANLSLLGYDPKVYYSGRGPLEAANLGVELDKNDLAFRFNFITESEGKILDYSAGHITNREAGILTEYLNKRFGSEELHFYFGTSYRNLLVVKGGKDKKLDKVRYYPPHDIMDEPILKYLPRGKNVEALCELIMESKKTLESHEINKVRIDLGENPANMIWPWGCGGKPSMPGFEEKFGLKGAVISAVDLIKGIGKIIGLKVLEVEGANGYYDTNYQGKAEAAVKSLDECDFVFIHIEATDEAGHNQDLRMKIACIERIDKMVVGTVLKAMGGKDYRILITPDHPTPVEKRTHTDEPVPFLISGSGIKAKSGSAYSETEAQASSLYFDRGSDLLAFFLKTAIID